MEAAGSEAANGRSPGEVSGVHEHPLPVFDTKFDITASDMA
jgi:hypothetical protein